MKNIVKIIFILILLSACNSNKKILNLDDLFKKHNVKGTFVLKNLKNQKFIIHNPQRSSKEYVPASTFKILNTMIALQVSAIASVDDTIKWDGVERRFQAWNKDQTIRTAFPISCVWFYQELARRIGKEQMQKWITAANYGNKKIENKIDKFWLDGKLAISAKEQVEFIEKLINNELLFDENIQKTVKKIMITDSTDSYIVHAKTGWGQKQKVGWNVGYIEMTDNIWIFALNIDMDNINMAEIRTKLVYEVISELKKKN